MLITALMAGRIYWIARKARSILGPGLSSKYTTMIAIIVESGVIYSVYFILDVVAQNLILDAGLAQIVGMVPTLIIVQVGLGRDAHDVDHDTAATTTHRTTRLFEVRRRMDEDAEANALLFRLDLGLGKSRTWCHDSMWWSGKITPGDRAQALHHNKFGITKTSAWSITRPSTPLTWAARNHGEVSGFAGRRTVVLSLL
ncbi:hypothetical protein CPB84DRAFT_1767465 [Gymnopilus junonius]|uniref:Uncharacterized protein n=1 Tax=Gymnopilus junonius TaxID=109634 RepID=A0A9P5TQX0_GYMJU|nr:hypothetical protein CPB84DRAFT_1767465 [Gymnopilus junonius]